MFILRWLGNPGEPREEPEGGPGDLPLVLLPMPGPSGLPSGSSPGSLEFPQATLRCDLLKRIIRSMKLFQAPLPLGLLGGATLAHVGRICVSGAV